MTIIQRWWLRRTVRYRITLVATTVTVLCLVLLAPLTSALQGTLLLDAADTDLRAHLDTATTDVTNGTLPTTTPGDIVLRVLDRGGDPVDGGPPAPLTERQVTELAAGIGVLDTVASPPRRWLGTVVTAPDGTQRLVVAGAVLVGYDRAQGLAFQWALVAAVLAGAAACVATWLAVGGSLRPVQRMRLAAAALPPGERLPVPAARDELRALAEAMNALLARRDEARQRLQRFTGDAAHELRSPVASIRAQAEVAVLHPDADLAQEVLTEVVAESERLSGLIDDLLVLSRSDAGELPAAGPVDLAFAAQSAIGRLTGDGPSVRLRVPTQSCAVWAAPAELDLVLDNLLRNAMRYARAQVTVFVLPTAGGGARLLVDDDGHGVPEEHRAKVFDRFYRVHDDRGRGTGGFGLGLALVAEVVRRRGGAVSVTESPDGGARFDVRWPGSAHRGHSIGAGRRRAGSAGDR
ncbi:MAG TPA: HAMP domain-containing sensor histidine kinase [Pseudonocardiaceae bacterium]|nr:HAMP domain-containing sensor histidine kinase [Pseudonocardiaceae bacterium]